MKRSIPNGRLDRAARPATEEALHDASAQVRGFAPTEVDARRSSSGAAPVQRLIDESPRALAQRTAVQKVQAGGQDRAHRRQHRDAAARAADSVGPSGHSPSPAQLFSKVQVARRAGELFSQGNLDHEKNWWDAKRSLIKEEYPDVEADDVMSEAWTLRERYMKGETLSRDQYKTMARGLTEEELAEAAESRKQIKYEPTLAPVEQGDRSWASSAMNEALNSLRKRLPQFTTGHHKVSKSKLALVVERMSADQRRNARRVLDLASEDAGTKAFKSLGSDVTSGPNSGLRLDERGRRPDINRYSSGQATPRSEIYSEIDLLLDTILSRPVDPAGVAASDYERLVEMLERAEKIHYLKTDGDVFDDEVSMWLEVPTEVGEASYWVRKSMPDVPPLNLDALKGKSVRDLKKSKYRAKINDRPKGSPIPKLFAGDTIERHDGFEYRAKYDSTLLDPSEERRLSAAKSGYRTRDVDGKLTRQRVDPKELRGEFAARLETAPSIDSSAVRSALDEVLAQIEAERHRMNFDEIRGGLVEKCAAIKVALKELDNGSEVVTDALANAARIVDLVMWFIEGDDSVETHEAEIATIMNGITVA